jgi:hypothetical protein
MITVTFSGPINGDKLNEELVSGGFPDAGITHDHAANHVYVEGVEESDRAAVEAIVAAHDHTQQTQAQQDRAASEARVQAGRTSVNGTDIANMRQNANAATSVPELRAIVEELIVLVGDLADAQGYTPTT